MTEELAVDLLKWLKDNEPKFLHKRYDIIIKDPVKALEDMALKRGCLIKGGRIDYLRISNMFLEEFRNSKLGRITLDRGVENEEEKIKKKII